VNQTSHHGRRVALMAPILKAPDLLLSDPMAWADRHGVGDSREDAQATALEWRAMLKRAQVRDARDRRPSPFCTARGRRPSGRPRGRRSRTTRSTRAGPGDGEPHEPPRAAR